MASKTTNMMSFSAQSSGSSSSSREKDHFQATARKAEPNRMKTAAIMYEFFEGATEADSTLTYKEKIQMRETINESIREDLREVTSQQVAESTRVVELLRKYGDDFHKEMKKDTQLWKVTVEALKEGTDSTQPMFVRVGEHLKEIISRMFETDEDGKRVITPGRICSVFMYCYEISKYVLKNLKKHTVATWLIDLTGCLIVSFAKARFYDWIEERGGWLKAIVDGMPPNLISEVLLGSPNSKIPNNLFLVGGVVLIGIWAYNKYIKN